MSYKKYLLPLMVVALATPKLFLAVDVELPDWFSDAASMTSIINGIGAEFDGDITWMQLWKSQLEAQLVELDKRASQRRQVYDCVRASFAEKDAQITACNQSVSERNATIVSLNNEVTTLEGTIVSLTADRDALAKQIADLHAAYATLLELSGDRVDELVDQINALKVKYGTMKIERDVFRTTLNDFYTRLAAHNHDAKAEGLALGKEFCGDDFSFDA